MPKNKEKLERQLCLELANKGIRLEDVIDRLNEFIKYITPIVNLAEENYNYLQKIKSGRKNV